MTVKYKMIDEYILVDWHKLFRIKALKDFPGVKAGELGGWVESYNDLSQKKGNCWVGANACAYDKAQVYGNALVCDNAKVYGEAEIHGDAMLCNNAQACGLANIFGKARIYEDSYVCENALICGNVFFTRKY